MPLATWLRTVKTRLDHQQPRRTGRRPAARKRATVRRRMEQLEDRLALSGFGLEDGAYIVESWAGSYQDVQIQPGDQKIVAAGSMHVTTDSLAVARYDSLGVADATYGSAPKLACRFGLCKLFWRAPVGWRFSGPQVPRLSAG